MTGAAAAVDRIPHDDGLPQLRSLLDPDRMATVLARSLRRDTTVLGVRILYLRYKPGTRLVVRYAITLDDGTHDATAYVEPASDLAAWARAPANLTLARRVDGRTPALEPLAYDTELGALIQWPPLDLTLPALAERPVELRRLLWGAGVDIDSNDNEPALLAYKARRRAVLRVDEHLVKIYAGAAEFANAVVGLEASRQVASPVVPAPEAVLPGAQLTSQTLLRGMPPMDQHAVAPIAGSALAALHGMSPTDLHPFPPDRQLAAAASSARSAAAVVPELAGRLDNLVRRLQIDLPDISELRAAHGDFHGNQVLELDGELAVIDFDEICAAPPALDFSSFAAHLVNGAGGELDAAAEAVDNLVVGYGSRPEGLPWYVATSILRRSPFPFRFLLQGWASRIERMVADAEEALAW